MKKKWTILECKHCLTDLGITILLNSSFLKITKNYQRKPSELMEISTTYLNQTISEMY